MKSKVNYGMLGIIPLIVMSVASAAILIPAQETVSSQGSPREIVRVFCTMANVLITSEIPAQLLAFYRV